jgi:hypothetical protein
MKRILIAIALTVVAYATVCISYKIGVADGVHHAEQCHKQYGIMKNDYEEHFICIY